MEKCAKEVGVKIVAGDTKVAGKGQVDQVFITTTGVGAIKDGIKTSGAYAKAGDAIIVTGDIGRHGTCILLERDDYGIEANVSSDCAPLWNAVDALTEKVKDVHVIRDATRGGVGTVLYEIAREANVGIKLENKKIPVAEEVRGVTGMLGLDPLYLACEGRMVIVVPACEADQTLQILHQSKHTENAALIGYVTDEHPLAMNSCQEYVRSVSMKMSLPISQAHYPDPFTIGLEFNPPVHETWNIVHIGMQVPKSIQIYTDLYLCG